MFLPLSLSGRRRQPSRSDLLLHLQLPLRTPLVAQLLQSLAAAGVAAVKVVVVASRNEPSTAEAVEEAVGFLIPLGPVTSVGVEA